jgi:hypothetical protein
MKSRNIRYPFLDRWKRRREGRRRRRRRGKILYPFLELPASIVRPRHQVPPKYWYPPTKTHGVTYRDVARVNGSKSPCTAHGQDMATVVVFTSYLLTAGHQKAVSFTESANKFCSIRPVDFECGFLMKAKKKGVEC